MKVVLIGVFGAAGALCRYGIGVATNGAAEPTAFPWATLAINLVGSFLLGFLLVLGPAKLDDDLVGGLGIGFLGAFTTFSTFSVETQTLLRHDRSGTAGAYVAASIVGGVVLAAAGYMCGRATR